MQTQDGDIKSNTPHSNEEQLLTYIDIPYFKNNPTYIDLWRRYYEIHHDPQILLLMFYKSISTHYHWIYIELSKHFVKINKAEIAYFILSEAIKNNVYDVQRLENALSRLPPFKRKYSRGDMMCILNQRNINAFGRVWNKYEEVYFYERCLDTNYINFEMMKISEYEGRKRAASLNFDGCITEECTSDVFISTIYFNQNKDGYSDLGGQSDKENNTNDQPESVDEKSEKDIKNDGINANYAMNGLDTAADPEIENKINKENEEDPILPSSPIFTLDDNRNQENHIDETSNFSSNFR